MESTGVQVPSARRREPRAPQGQRIEFDYKTYRIVAGNRNGLPVALAYAGRAVVLSTDGETVDLALASLKGAIDLSIAKQLEARGDGAPSADDYRAALLQTEHKTPPELRRLLQIHHALPGHATTLADLAHRARCEPAILLANYARLARRLGKLLHYAPTSKIVPRSLVPLLILAEPEDACQAETCVWVMRPNLSAALDVLDQA